MRAARDRRPDQRPALSGAADGGDPAQRRRRRFPRALFQRARRWLKPPRLLRPTRAGWVFFALTFGVGFAALNTGNNLLYLVLSLMLAFLVLSGLLSEAALRGISVRRRLPGELCAEPDGWVTLEIENRQSRLTAYAVAVEDRIVVDGVERAAGRCFALRLEAGARAERSYRIRPDRRGELRFAGFGVFTRFPFGLFSKSLALAAEARATVYPALDAEVGELPRLGTREQGQCAEGSRGPGASVAGVREFAPGDPPRRIDWRSSLRSGALWVREVEAEQDGEIWVRLRTEGARPGEDFEREVRRSASEVARYLEQGLRVGLRSGPERFEPAGGPEQRACLLSHLADVTPAATGAA